MNLSILSPKIGLLASDFIVKIHFLLLLLLNSQIIYGL